MAIDPQNALILWNRAPHAVEALLRKALSRFDGEGPSSSPSPVKLDLEISLALAIMYQRRLHEARNLIQMILKSHPDQESALWCEAQLRFYLGEEWPGVWDQMEHRWGAGYSGARPFDATRVWDGSPLNGRSVLLAGEGGLGDQIMFIRFAPLLKAAGAGHLTVSADAGLIPFLQTMPGVDAFVAKTPGSNEPGREVAFDAGVPMLSAPACLRTTLSTLPAEVPYLAVPRIFVEAARERMRSTMSITDKPVLNVGLCWRANKKFRSVPLEIFRPLLDVPGVRLFGLGEASVIEEECAAFPMTNLGGRDILSSAGAVAALDLVIAPDTMMVHLAGSLGRPVWLVLHYLADWRWPFTGETTPWYPTARLFRRESEDWESVTRQLVDELTAKALTAGLRRDSH